MRPRGGCRIFNGAASLKTRKSGVSFGMISLPLMLQWGRVPEDAEMISSGRPMFIATWLQWGRVPEDAEIRNR